MIYKADTIFLNLSLLHIINIKGKNLGNNNNLYFRFLLTIFGKVEVILLYKEYIQFTNNFYKRYINNLLLHQNIDHRINIEPFRLHL